MDITPVLTTTRFSQLKPGELFIFPNDTASAVALAVADPARDGDMVMIPLGPGTPSRNGCANRGSAAHGRTVVRNRL